jgi:hypothetical protein
MLMHHKEHKKLKNTFFSKLHFFQERLGKTEDLLSHRPALSNYQLLNPWQSSHSHHFAKHSTCFLFFHMGCKVNGSYE